MTLEAATDNILVRLVRLWREMGTVLLKKYLPALLLVLVGVSVSCGRFAMVRGWEQMQLRDDFARVADAHAGSLRDLLRGDLDTLYSLRNFYTAAPTMDRGQFHAFAAGVLARHPGIQALEWLPRVSADDRSTYERFAQQDGLATFQFSESAANGRLAPEAVRPEYFPVYYLEPVISNEAAVGLDASTRPEPWEAMQRARDTGQAVVSRRLALVQETGHQYGVVFYLPVYERGAVVTTVEQRRQHLVAFATVVLRVGDVAQVAMHDSAVPDASLRLLDAAAAPDARLLYASSPDSAAQTPPGGLRWSTTLDIGSRSWELDFTPTAAFYAGRHDWQSWLLLGLGLVATVAVAFYLLSASNRAQMIERLVAQRTGQLANEVEERKRAEAELGRQFHAADGARSETRAILDATSEAVVFVGPDRRFLAVNRRFEELFGVPAAEVLGREYMELQPFVERAFTDPAALAALVIGTARDAERRFSATLLQRWPQQRELDLYSTPVPGADGAVIGRLFVFRDVSHERAVDRMKTEFVSLVSHELRTPLTSIKGYIDLLLHGEAGPVPELQREFLHIVGSNADRLVSLINELLDLSRIEAGRLELTCAPLDVAELLRRVATAFRPQLEQKRQHLHLSCAQLLPSLHGDADRLTQVFTNLLSNAHKYTAAGGDITIRAFTEHGTLRVDVSDTGIGMTEEDLGHLFSKFFRARNRATQDVGGTGLGLAISRSLVQMHGGRIAVTSAAGEGSTFSVILPVAAEQDTGMAERQSALTGIGR